MTTPAEGNVHALAVDGDFDDCQARLKDMFNDFAFRDRAARGGELDQLGTGARTGRLLFLPPPSRSARLTERSASPCRRAISATSSPAVSPSAWVCPSAGWWWRPTRTTSSTAACPPGLRRRAASPVDLALDGHPGFSSNFERALFDAYGRDGAAVAQLMDELRRRAAVRMSARARCRRCARSSQRPRARRRKRWPTIARAHDSDGGAALPAHRHRRACRPRRCATRRADGHARHRASGEVPRRGGTGDRASARPFPIAWPICMTGRSA